MRERHEIESDAEDKYTEGGNGPMGYCHGETHQPTTLEVLRLILEVHLDIRDKLEAIYMEIPDEASVKTAVEGGIRASK